MPNQASRQHCVWSLLTQARQASQALQVSKETATAGDCDGSAGEHRLSLSDAPHDTKEVQGKNRFCLCRLRLAALVEA